MGRENFRYFSILDGANVTNEDETGASSYYGFTRPGGSWVIMRVSDPSGTPSYDFHLNDGPDEDLSQYDTDWTNRASLDYKRAGILKHL